MDVIEILVNQFLLDICFIIEMLVNPADMQTHSIYDCFILNFKLFLVCF